MYFSVKELTDLVMSAVQENIPAERDIHQLVYFLHFPSEEVPLTIAELLCSDDNLLSKQNRLGKRLAWGHVEDISQIRDIEIRANKQLRISRQLNRIVIYLSEHKAPSTIGNEFSSLLEHFVHVLHYFDARKENSTLAYAAEEILLLETMIESLIISKSLSSRFLCELFERLKPQQVKIVALSLKKRLMQAEIEDELKSKSEDEALNESLILPSDALPFKKSLREHEKFKEAILILEEILEKFTGSISAIH